MKGLLDHLGRQTVRLGTSPDCEVLVSAPYPNCVLALVVHTGEGQLAFVPEFDDVCSHNGIPLAGGEVVIMNGRGHFTVGETSISAGTPEVATMLMARGELAPSPTELVLGRDPAVCHLVLHSPFVSGRHLTFHLESQQVTDHGSTSGTFTDTDALEAEVKTKVPPGCILFLGPHAVPVTLLLRIASELSAPVAPVPTGFVIEDRTPTEGSLPLEKKLAEEHDMAPVAPPPPSFFAPLPPRPHSTVLGTIRMEASRAYRIGRRDDNDIILDHRQISSRHARLVRIGPHVYLEDADSDLGTFVRGTRLRAGQRAEVTDGEEVRFGPMTARLHISKSDVRVLIDDREDWAGKPLFEIEAHGVSLVVPDRHQTGATVALLEDISFKALPGDFIALMGPSGSGKTTLLHTLTGYTKPTAGLISINGRPLDVAFESLRGSIGYVPQDDIIHPELTVFEAVRYSARFRLPPDYTDQEIDERVHSTLLRLGLENVAHLQIGRPEQKVISGGQRKRVNIAMELVSDPVLLFLDEPTSGLAADDTTALVELLAGLSREQGKTIVATIHQPAKDEYEKFNLALVLGHGGQLIYFGRTLDAYAFFESWRPPRERQGLSTPRDMFAELAEREARLQGTMPGSPRSLVRRKVAQSFAQDYRNSSLREAMLQGPRAPGAARDFLAPRARKNPGRGQLRLLLSRYVRVKVRDRVGTAILLLQAPLIGVLLALVFGAKKPAVPYWCLGALESLSRRVGSPPVSDALQGPLQATQDNAGALFFLVVSAVWFGTSNAAREIVGERAIFRRESMINLQTPQYVLSKFLVLGGLCVLQCTMLLSIVFWALHLAGGKEAFFTSLSLLVLTSLCSVALGLALSSFVDSTEAAMALTPIALIPQVVLGGIMVPVTTNPYLEPAMWLVPARWGFDGIARIERTHVASHPAWSIPLPGAVDSLPDFIVDGEFRCALAQLKSHTLPGAWGFGSGSYASVLPYIVLTAMTALLLGAVTRRLVQRH